MADKVTISAPFQQSSRSLGTIGRVGENLSRQILFDCSSALKERETASISCVMRRPTDTAPYLKLLDETETEGVLSLVLTSTDTAYPGNVSIELRMTDGEEVLKTAIYIGVVEPSMNAEPIDPGSPEEDMLTELGEAAGKATLAAKAANEAAASVDESKAAAVAAAEAATQAASKADASAAQADTAAASAEESASNADASAAKADTATANANDAADKATAAATTASESASKADSAAASATTAATNAQNVADTVQAKLDAGELKGEKGDQGDTGNSGKDCVYMDYTIPAGYITPYVSTYNVPVTAFTNTPSGGTIIVALHADGYLGRWVVKNISYVSGGYVVVLALNAIRKITGADGISPTVTTSKADGVTTVTITDKDGAHTANIEDGAKGDAGAEALRATKNYAATYTTIGCDASWSTDFFNRMPVVGDIFTNIDASSNTGTWKITSVSGGLAHFTLLSYVSSKGADGFSPTATVTKSGTTTTVTVTDKTGTTTAEVKDGSDATVTKDNIVSALGYEPQKPEGNYELIETITLTEDTSEIVRTQEPDGTAYHFGGIVVIVYAKSTINNDYIRLHGSKGNYITFGRASSTTAYEQRLTLKIVNGMIDFSGSNQAGNNSEALHRGGADVLYTSYFDNNWINKIKITADGAMIAGGTVTIYASRRS